MTNNTIRGIPMINIKTDKGALRVKHKEYSTDTNTDHFKLTLVFTYKGQAYSFDLGRYFSEYKAIQKIKQYLKVV